MKEKEQILTPEQAIAAISLDLRRYDVQTVLCAEILRVILRDATAVQRIPNKSGLWIRGKGRKMRHFDGKNLIEYVCETLAGARLSPQTLAALCRRVFQVSCEAVPSGSPGTMRIHINTDMDGFQCRLCGHCCRVLDYRHEVNADDVQRWKAEKRDDILEWVGITRGNDQEPRYQIWVIPGSTRFAETCPFLKRGPSNEQWICAIQDTKPDICRHYPANRKHAVLTGCLGFKT